MRIGAYEILAELGRGAMGVVYRVRTPEGRDAALKLLVGVKEAAFARFDRERRLLASLGEEDGFVGLLDAGSAPEGSFLVMPFVSGGTLRQRLDAGPLRVEETISLGVSLARALGRAHERGIVHRDVKPENILFTASGGPGSRPVRPLIADLGLAKHFDPLARGASQSVKLTTAGVFKGTAGYAPPEQLEDSARVGPSADVFALGAVLYECLAGRPVFFGENPVALLASVSSGVVAHIERDDVPAWLEKLLRRALASTPRARFDDGAALARALEARGAARSRSLAAPLAVGAVVGGGVLGGVALAGRAPPPPVVGPREPEASPVELEAKVLVAVAGEKIKKRDLDGAIADCSKAIEVAPALAVAWTQRATAREGKGDLDGAIADTTKAIELDPRSIAAWVIRGRLRSQERDWAGAIADESRAIELAPRDAVAWANRGRARSDQGDVDGALADLTKAIELDASFGWFFVNRGNARARKEDFDGAVADYERALALDPREPRVWIGLGAAHGNQRNFDAAVADLSKAIALDPRLAHAWFNRGIAKLNKGDREGAVTDLERSLELEPNGPSAADARQTLAELGAR